MGSPSGPSACIPGHVPRVFKTVRMRLEIIDIARYIEQMMAAGGPEQFKKSVMRDLDQRRDTYCVEEKPLAA